MKTIVVFCILFSLIQISLQKASIEGDCNKAQLEKIADYKNGCYQIFCHPSGSHPGILPCGLRSSDCGPGKRFVGTKFDHEKEYPDCCVQIICEEFKHENASNQ